MSDLPPAWSLPEPQWVKLAPGVKWLLRRPDGAMQIKVNTDVGVTLGRVYEGRAALEELGVADDLDLGRAFDLEKLQGYSAVLAACLYAQHCLVDWEGIEDPQSGDKLDPTDAPAVRAALIHGAPPVGTPLLTPFLAWLETPRLPMAAEAARLLDLAKDHWGGGAERCRACRTEGEGCAKGESTEGEICPALKWKPRTPSGAVAWAVASQTPGLWIVGGLGGLAGLDYRAALLTFETMAGADADLGAGFKALQAIELGRLEAEAAKAPPREPTDG